MTIYLSHNASDVEKNAASELSLWLGKACHLAFPIRTESDGGVGIYVGHTDFAASRGIAASGGRNELNGAESWRICAADGSLVITGGRTNTDRGILYAAEHYLEDVIGIRFWNAAETYIPEIADFTVDPALDLSGEPEMVMRSVSSRSYVGNDPIHMVRSRMNYSVLPEAWGGGVMCSRRGHCHTTFTIMPPDGLYETHPEWFAWNETLQKHLSYGQYCLNNESFLQAFEEAFLADIAKLYAECDEKGTAYPHHFHISLEDNDFVCECPVCRERMAKSGFTGNVLRFVNRMAEAAAKVYPDVLVETLAYWNYMDPPLDDTVPAKNVIVRIANLEIDILHDLDHPNNARGLRALSRWSEICRQTGAPLYVWDYNVIYTGTFTPNITRLKQLYRTYAKYGVQAAYVENEEPILTDFWVLKQWLLTHLLENPHADTDALIAEYMQQYYGAAAPLMTEWLWKKEAVTDASGLHMCCVRNFNKADHIPYELYIEGLTLFAAAETAVAGDADLTRRVRQARASLDLSICLRYESLTYQAAKRGESFPITREEAGRRYMAIVEETAAWLKSDRADAGIPVWEGAHVMEQWQTPYIAPPLPPQLAGTDAMQVSVSDYVILNSKHFGVSHRRDDDSLSGWAACLRMDDVTENIRDEMQIYPRSDARHPFTMSLTRRGAAAMKKSFALEELTPDAYEIYHLFDVDEITEDSDANLRIVSSAFYFHIAGLALLFPGKKLSLLMRAKFSGAAYGGDASEPDMISFDRLYIVPRD